MKPMVSVALLAGVLFVTPSAALDFPTVSGQVDATFDVIAAQIELEQAQKSVQLQRYPEDYSLSLNPTTKVTSLVDGDFGEEVAVSANIQIKAPVGMSALEKERLAFALDSLEIADTSLSIVQFQAYEKLFSLYQAAWLLQQEQSVIELELGAAELYRETLLEQFQAGRANMAGLSSAEEDYAELENALTQNQLEQRLAWFALVSYGQMNLEPEKLDSFSLQTEEIPEPPELAVWLKENHPSLKGEYVKVRQLQQTMERLESPDIGVGIKPFYTYEDHSASLTFDPYNPGFTGSYSFPLQTFGEIPSGSGSSVSTWSTGLTVEFSIGSNKNDSLEAEVLSLDLKTAESRIAYLTDSLNLSLRSAYQKYLRSQDLLEQARMNLLRSESNLRLVGEMDRSGRVTVYDRREAEAVAARDRWKIESARIETEKAWLDLLDQAVWFDQVSIPGRVNNE